MDLKEIKKRIKEINDISKDSEVAHSKEDDLYYDFVVYISMEGTEEQQKMAKAILKTKNINFARWCA